MAMATSPSRLDPPRVADPSFPNLPPTNIHAGDRPLGRWTNKFPIRPHTPAEVATPKPRTSGIRLQRIGQSHRQQILNLDFRERKPFLRQAMLNFQVSFPTHVLE